MSKIFRIHDRGPGNNSDWFGSDLLSLDDLNTISAQNENGKIATSIPSPFARFELVKAAFKAICESRELIGSTNNHKLISDALDVGQLFYYFHEIKNIQGLHCEIVAWNPNSHIEELKNNPNSKIYGNTLELFWNRDGNAYGYNRINRIFILKINHMVVGATSPSNLFIAAPDVSTLDFNFQFGNVRLFDNQYESLAERDSDFIKFLFALRERNKNNFSEYFKEFSKYLDLVLENLKTEKNTLWTEIKQINKDNFENDYQVLNMSGGNPVEVMKELKLYCHQPRTDLIPETSDFAIKCSDGYSEKLLKIPLVLPANSGYSDWRYTDRAKWDENIEVPEYDERELSDRILPGQPDKYPYLSIGDFLEENIYVLPNGTELNVDKFHLFKENAIHLIPLKPEIFKYYSISDLVRNNMLKFDYHFYEEELTHITVMLSIPVKRDTIDYVKIYKVREDKIIELDVSLGLFPLLKFENNNIINYHIGFLDRTDEGNSSINFYKENSKIEQNYDIRNRNEDGGRSVYFKVKEPFDFIRIVNKNNFGGLIIPKFSNVIQNKHSVYIAIDFGTSNTHVELKIENGEPQKLEVDGIYSSFIKRGSQNQIVRERLLKMELLPDSVGKDDSDCKFPLRTAILTNRNSNWDRDIVPFLDTNVAYYYGKIEDQSHHKIFTNLKWADLSNREDKKKLENYIQGILEVIKLKLISENISLNNISVLWMYPVSMTIYQLKHFDSTWNLLVNSIFGNNVKIFSLPESIAPYHLYSNRKGLSGITASIDIGGGTSDYAIFDREGEIKLISSVNFAGNAIYGDGYNNGPDNNGFIRQYKEEFFEFCNNIGDKSSPKIFEKIEKDNPQSVDLCNFFYSIDSFDFSGRLSSNDNLKFIFVLFYSIKAFYLANLFKKLKLDIPRNIIFSGTGSKSLNIIDPSRSKEIVCELFQFFFDEIYKGESKLSKISQIQIAESPKEVSCKGALHFADEDPEVNISGKIGYWCGREDEDIIKSGKFLTYMETDSTHFKNEVIKSIKKFYEIFDLYSKTKNLRNTFDVRPKAILEFENMRNEELVDFIEKGIKSKIKSADDDKNAQLTEGVLFYAFVGLLNKLGSKLSE